jgi:Velvet factor
MSAPQSHVPQQESNDGRSKEKKTRTTKRNRKPRYLRRQAQQKRKLQWSVNDLVSEKPAAVAKPEAVAKPAAMAKPEYEMYIAIQPPEVAPLGSVLRPSVTALLRARDPLTQKELPLLRYLPGLWAIASAVPKEYQGQPMASNTFMLCGSMVDSAHPFSDLDRSTGAGGGTGCPERLACKSYFNFPNLYFSEKGEYRIRVMLMKMERTEGSGNSYGGCVMLKHAISDVVKVVDPVVDPVAEPAAEPATSEFLLRDASSRHYCSYSCSKRRKACRQISFGARNGRAARGLRGEHAYICTKQAQSRRRRRRSLALPCLFFF